jgi:hypothetical protein
VWTSKRTNIFINIRPFFRQIAHSMTPYPMSVDKVWFRFFLHTSFRTRLYLWGVRQGHSTGTYNPWIKCEYQILSRHYFVESDLIYGYTLSYDLVLHPRIPSGGSVDKL